MEVNPSHRQVRVVEASQPSAARYAAQEVAETAGFDTDDVHRTGLVATELATNLVKHAHGGEFLMRAVRGRSYSEVEMVAIDRGPGMNDVARCLADGYSTAGSGGNGLGAVQRLADEFDIHSERGRGTVVLTRMRAGRVSQKTSPLVEVAGVSIAKEGETVCGDAWQVYQHADGVLVVVADGLGHGYQAKEAAVAAIGTVDQRRAIDLPALLETMHAGIRHTRGAAVGLAEIRPYPHLMKFAGVGNVAGVISRVGNVRHAVSINGTLGHQARHFREYAYPWAADATLVMHSDGLGSHWSLDEYRGLRARHPVVVAAVLYRDFSRQRDDVTVLVGREVAA